MNIVMAMENQRKILFGLGLEAQQKRASGTTLSFGPILSFTLKNKCLFAIGAFDLAT